MPDWEGTTSVFFEEAYNDERPRGGVQRHGGRDGHNRDADRGPAGVDGGRPRRGLGGGGGVGDDVREGRDRALQSEGYTIVVVMYVQETWYLIDDPSTISSVPYHITYSNKNCAVIHNFPPQLFSETTIPHHSFF
jgi:hypothetical protein